MLVSELQALAVETKRRNPEVKDVRLRARSTIAGNRCS